MTRLSNRQYLLLKTFAEAGASHYMTIVEASATISARPLDADSGMDQLPAGTRISDHAGRPRVLGGIRAHGDLAKESDAAADRVLRSGRLRTGCKDEGARDEGARGGVNIVT
jgi:hypothetical protein